MQLLSVGAFPPLHRTSLLIIILLDPPHSIFTIPLSECRAGALGRTFLMLFQLK